MFTAKERGGGVYITREVRAFNRNERSDRNWARKISWRYIDFKEFPSHALAVVPYFDDGFSAFY